MADNSASEIRCEEKAKGGIKYDVILAEPAANPPAIKSPAPSLLRSESIEEKLKKAEERRASLEASKIAKAAALSKIEEALKKKNEIESEYKEQTKEALEKRIENVAEKRSSYINEVKEKLKDHDRRVEDLKNAALKKAADAAAAGGGDNKENGCTGSSECTK